MRRSVSGFRRALPFVTAFSLLAAGTLLSGCETRVPPEPVTTKQSAPDEPPLPSPAPQPQVQVDPPQAEVAPVAPLSTSAAAVRIALLAPLSGPSGQVGQSMLNAAQMAVFDVAGENFVLLPIDTKGTPEGAAEAARIAVSQDVDLILGPVFSGSVASAKPVAQQAGINMVAFSTDRSVAGPGSYVLGFLPGPQVDRVVGHAQTQGLSRFAALVPNSSYGRIVTEALERAVAEGGGSLVAVEFYDQTANDFSGPAKAIANRAEAIDAVLIPDEGGRLRSLGSQLAFQGLDTGQVKLLGTMLWDDPRLGLEPAMIGAWYALPPNDQYSAFLQRYGRDFNARPPRVASLAYDATALAAVLARRGGDFSIEALTNPNGFAGIDGIFRLMPDGTSERGYMVVEVTREGPQPVGPAPQSFESPGF